MEFTNLNALDMGRIWDGALKILGDVGLAVAGEKIRRIIAGKLPLKDGRVCIPAETAEHYADEIRSRFGGEQPPDPSADIQMGVSSLNSYWLDPADGRMKLHDTEAVIRNTRLLRQLADEGLVGGSVAGVPQDVPARMQFLMAHYINCVYSREPFRWSISHSETMLRYVLEIADVMGLSKSIGTEMISPLKFMDQSIDLAIDFHSQGVAVGIDPMPILGVTAPADWHIAWAQSVAENLGSYVIFRECGVENLGVPSFRLFLPNPTSCTTYFSSPQHICALLARRKVRAFFNLLTPAAELMLVTSKVADQQAAMEKMAGCLLGKLCGFSRIEGAGGLWMDEIFSPQQLLIDIEIKHFVEGITADFDEPERDIVAVMKEGVRSGSFMAADLTLDRFREFLWKSELFDLRPRGAWEGDHHTLLNKAAHIAEEKAAAYTYDLTDHRREALDRIMARARLTWPEP